MPRNPAQRPFSPHPLKLTQANARTRTRTRTLHPNAHPADGPAEDRAAELQARADALRALLDGTLDPVVDAGGLLVLRDDVFRIVLDALAPPTPGPGPEQVPPPSAEQTPLQSAKVALREALRAFFLLTPQARAELLSAHQSKMDASLAGQRRADAWQAETTRLAARAAAMEGLSAGVVEPGTDTQMLARVELLALLPAASSADTPPDEASLAALTSRNAASARLRAALEAWMALSEEDRASRRDAAEVEIEIEIDEAEVDEPEPEPELPETFVDEEEAQDREDISERVEEAADAAREKEEALDRRRSSGAE